MKSAFSQKQWGIFYESFLHSWQQAETTPVPFNWWMDKETLIPTQGNTTQQWKGITTDTWDNTDESQLHSMKRKMPDAKPTDCVIPSMWPWGKNTIGAENRVVSRGWELGRTWLERGDFVGSVATIPYVDCGILMQPCVPVKTYKSGHQK